MAIMMSGQALMFIMEKSIAEGVRVYHRRYGEGTINLIDGELVYIECGVKKRIFRKKYIKYYLYTK